jgi:outer membrane translocation and assembly module TamA
MHDFKPFSANEAMKFRFELTIFNALNTNITTNLNSTLLHENDGYIGFAHDADVFKGYNTRKLMSDQKIRVSPYYGWANSFQSPRSMRIQLSFFF